MPPRKRKGSRKESATSPEKNLTLKSNNKIEPPIWGIAVLSTIFGLIALSLGWIGFKSFQNHVFANDPLRKSTLYKKAVKINNETKFQWDSYTSHRHRVMNLVMDVSKRAGGDSEKKPKKLIASSVVKPIKKQNALFFGAGNCNDLDLRILLDRFNSVTLVDMDDKAIREGVQRQLGQDHDRVLISPSIDLTNMFTLVNDWEPKYDRRPPEKQIEKALKATQATYNIYDYIKAPNFMRKTDGYDVSVSLCIFSQYAASLAEVLQEQKPYQDHFMKMIGAIRNRQIAQVVAALRVGGYGLLVVDFITEEYLQEMLLVNEADSTRVEELTNKAMQQGTYFRGTQRYTVMRHLTKGYISPYVDNVELISPWKWTLSSTNQRLVYGVLFRRKEEQL